MKSADHFIEVVRSQNFTRLINYPVQPINKMKQNLETTKAGSTTRTIAIWKIKSK